jgi:hypothetical protein
MGSVDLQLASDLVVAAGLRRAVETGTYRGRTARALAGVFATVVTIELSPELHRAATEALQDVPSVRLLQGHSAQVLGSVRDPATPTLFFLDGHWSGGVTAGVEDECPVLGEIEAIAGGHPDDCLLIDDAQLFTSAPPAPHDPAAWPRLVEVFDAIRAHWPEHVVTLLDDQVLAVPARAAGVVDRYGERIRARTSVLDQAKGVASGVRERLVRHGLTRR